MTNWSEDSPNPTTLLLGGHGTLRALQSMVATRRLPKPTYGQINSMMSLEMTLGECIEFLKNLQKINLRMGKV